MRTHYPAAAGANTSVRLAGARVSGGFLNASRHGEGIGDNTFRSFRIRGAKTMRSRTGSDPTRLVCRSGTGVTRDASTTPAEITIINPTAHIPARAEPSASSSAPVTYGAANPPRLPTELISPMPPTAAAPVRNLDGSAKSSGSR